MSRLFVAILAFFASSYAMAETKSTVQYHISITNPQTHYASVSVTAKAGSDGVLHFSMPVWTPGSYLVREFARNMENIKATCGGQPIAVQHVSKNSWMVSNCKNQEVTFSYDLYAFELSVRTSFIDAAQAFLHNTSVFVMVEEYKNQPGTVAMQYPAEWKQCSSSMGMLDGKYQFADYDELGDSPIEIGNHELLSFEVRGIPHQVAMVGLNNADPAKFTADLKKMCETMTNIVDAHPCNNYLFIVQHVEAGGGGLEHKNSCTVMMPRWNYIDAGKYQSFLGLCAHEYFHLWNVKRIRPVELGPFDYLHENHTRQLWVAEGITSYYDELALLRAGLVGKSEFLNTLETYINALENRPGSKVQTLAESSFDAWIKEYRPNENSKNTSISYYSKGLVVAALLDAQLSTLTKGEKHLDDLMRLLYQRFYIEKKRGFTEAEFISAASEIARIGMQSFFDQYVYSLQVPDYKGIFGSTGLLVTLSTQTSRSTGLSTALENGRTVVKSVTRNSPAWVCGINVNDELIAVNGARISNNTEEIIRQIGNPGILTFIVNRAGIVSEITMNMVPTEISNISLDLPAKPEPELETILSKWLGTH